MTTPSLTPRSGRPSPPYVGARRRAAWLSLGLAAAVGAAGCTAEPTPSPTLVVTPSAAPTASGSPAKPTLTPEPPLSLAFPEAVDPRQISVTVTPEVAVDGGGVITVTVTSTADAMIDEFVLRWPTELLQTIFLAPSVPDPDLVREGGGNLVVPWTKWVIGPGEQGEPDGTTSLGYGPLEAGATLTIPLYVTRLAPGPTSFDLQLLAGESILALPDGQPAELRVEVP
ncbi:MAG: hypothetical protein ABI841_06985 [Chloroflexota bacterium]